jgi:DNA replication protein DnaC
MTQIDETIKKIGENMSKENSQTSSTTRPYPGDPNCPICNGVGFIHQDLPLGHPDFGKLQICSCRQNELARNAHERLFRLSNLDAFKNMTFETFNTQGRFGLGEQQITSLRVAHSQAMMFSQNLKGWLLLMGGYGCGKTHIAASIANFVIEYGVPVLFLTVPDLLDWLRVTYSDSGTAFEDRFEEIRNIRLLVLDDLGTQNATSWAQEKLYQIVNHRYVNRLPMVVTTNQRMEEIDGRIRSRLMDPDLVTRVEIHSQDYRSPVQDAARVELSTLNLHNARTFGNFSMREPERLATEEQKSLERAFKVTQEFAEHPRGWLIISGPYGTGKTHLAAAIGNYRFGLGESPMFVVVPDLLDHLRATFSPNSPVSYDRLFDQVRLSPLLILDDLGTQSATPWAREKLYQLINYRYTAELPTVVTTADTLDEMDPRIRSRMMDKRLCEYLLLKLPPYLPGSGNLGGRSRKITHQRKSIG